MPITCTDGSAEYHEGGCSCGQIRYRLKAPPLFTNCCHCTWCQRETGSAFVINSLIENDYLEVVQGVPNKIEIPTLSGKSQTIARCPNCQVALWSHYTHKHIAFIRTGTLDYPQNIEPGAHIYISTKQPWVKLPETTPAFEGYYSTRELWPEKSLERLAAVRDKKA
ncbi:GFA family protein [Microvirga sp. W0021]|uniref:GFA family protein n=1 Tax=Hohaiivirga grylli TaxID=3133970 RepID=A0ABV0BKW0_9HYPH